MNDIMAPSFTCPRCGATSRNPNDLREGYCARCHDWTAPPQRVALGEVEPCPKCGSGLEHGFGLAGGGYGPYTYCSNEECDFFDKVQEPIDDGVPSANVT